MIRRKRHYEGNPWPKHWDVSQEWKHGRTVLTHLAFDFQVKGVHGWFTFDRYVKNTRTGTEWVDGFLQHPFGGYVSYRPERITRVRKHVEPKKPAGRASAA